jgi:hypothetical protein
MNKHQIIGALVLTAIFVFIGAALWHLGKSESRIGTEFRRLRALGLAATTRAEWDTFLTEATAWEKTLWHRSHGSMSGELRGIAQGRRYQFYPLPTPLAHDESQREGAVQPDASGTAAH